MTRRLFLPLLALLAACGPKSTTGGTAGTGKGVIATPTPVPDAEIRSLLGLALGAGRLSWSDPGIRVGERLRWRVLAMGSPDIVIEVKRSEPPDRWIVSSGPNERSLSRSVTAELAPDGATATKLSWKDGSAPAIEIDSARIASLFPRATLADESGFTAAGGSLMGPEVVRVPAGDFRARHAVIDQGGTLWHYYVARSVPGGVVKAERFEGGANDPSLTMELLEYTKLPKPAPTPNPIPMSTALPSPTPAPAP